MSPVAVALLVALATAGQVARPNEKVDNSPPRSAPGSDIVADENLLKAAGLPPTDAALLEFFRKRVPPAPPREAIAKFVDQLGDKVPGARDQAAEVLIAVGYAAVPLLRPAANRVDDEELSGRARRCLEYIEGPLAASLTGAALRVLAARKPAGVSEALLGYVPFAENDGILQEIEAALLACGLRDGKPDPALLEGLKDPVPVRRWTAARVLCRGGGAAERAAVRPLLKDLRPSVRLQAALSLAAAREAEAVTVLIDLLAELPLEGRKQAEEFLAELAGDWAVTGPPGNDRLSGRLRREVWSAWWRSTDGPLLLEELRSRTLTDDEREHVLGQIRLLDDASEEVREKASQALADFGPRACPLLRRAIQQGQAGSSQRVAECLASLERAGSRPLPAAAPNLLALRRPAGVVEALLAYLPFADPESIDGLVDLLASLGCTDGKAAPALVQALADRVADRRVAAAMAVCRGRAEQHLAAVRKLLDDPDLRVRLGTAQALAGHGDRAAVGSLVSLLGVLPEEQLGEAIDFLMRLAGDDAPAVNVEADPKARGPAMEAWKSWWREKGPNLDMARVAGAHRASGLFLVVDHQGGRVLEVAPTGKVRWQVSGINYPWDAQVLPNGRLLVVDQGNRVSERDRQGKVLWQTIVPNVIAAQRLPNGHTFAVTRNALQVLDREGKQAFNYAFAGGWIMAGRRLRDGSMALVTYQGQYLRVDAQGKEIKRFMVPFNPNFGVSGAEVLPGDRVLIAVPNPAKVTEYGADGKVVWEASVNNPGFPTRLANGHTLVPVQGGNVVTELDRSGRVISERKDLPYTPFRIIPR
jgi:HEAT repeat protein